MRGTSYPARRLFAWTLCGFLLCAAGAKAGSDEGALKKKIQELNRLTGGDPMQGMLRTLMEDKEGTKKLVAAALPLAKEKKDISYNASLVLALASADLKDLGASETFFRVCMDQAAKMQSAQKLLQSYGGLIDILYNNKKFDESERICRELLELKTDDGKPRIVLHAIKTNTGEIDFIPDDEFDTARRLRPGVHRLLIQAITKQGKYEQAVKLIDNLIKAQDHWLERQLKGWVLREAGKLEEAAKTYEDVLVRVGKDKDLDDEDREYYTERNRYLLSNIYLEANKVDKAVEQLRELLAKKPDDPGYNNDLGYIMADHDMNLDESEKLVRKALDLDRKRRKANPDLKPEDDHDNGAYLDSLAWVFYKQKRYKEAKEVLLDAVKDKSSQHLEIYDHLGDVHMALGERELALQAWQKGLEVVGESRRDQERRVIVEKKIAKVKE
ncbi:MAG: tetratricopeptide repeat protein [Gemmataceae bacterium]|nr:tetratricopeptide repeat protein [Gemmataceae bacterium]